MAKTNTSTGGRAATTGIIPGKWALSVGKPSIPAPPGFNWTPLSEIARLESGHTPSRRNPEYWDGNVPWIGIRDATGNHGRTITSTLQTITQAGLDNSSARLLPAGTVCLSRTASVGYVVTMGAPMATSQDFINWVCGPKLSPRYLHYILVMEQDSVRRFAHGTTHQTVYYPEAKAFHVCIPNREEQNRIASMLGALDDKIAVNERITATADELARTHFRAGFSLALDYVTDGTSLPPEWAVSTIGDSATTVETGIRPKGVWLSTRPALQASGPKVSLGLGNSTSPKQNLYPKTSLLICGEELSRTWIFSSTKTEGSRETLSRTSRCLGKVSHFPRCASMSMSIASEWHPASGKSSGTTGCLLCRSWQRCDGEVRVRLFLE